ncbi:hypothetical protein BDQ17DRAFT_1345134 [Cyathus striatus]|nr:hypothetical protein BDQ17DRAFT_1345134 [Cyathus striatus]
MASSKDIEQHNRKNPSPENSTPPLENLTYTSSRSIPSSSENATSPTEDLKLTQCKNVPSSKWNKQQKRKRSTTPEVSDSQILPESLSHDNETHSKTGASRIQKIYGTFSRKRTRRSQSPHAYTTSKTSFTAPWSIFTDDRERKRLSAFFNNEKGSSLSGASQNPLPAPVVLGPPLLNSPDEIHETVSPITPFKSLTQSRGEQEQDKDKHESQSRIKKWITSLSMSPRKRQKVAESRHARVDIQPLVTSVSQLDLGANIMKSGEERCGSRMLPGLIIRSLTADEVKTIDNQEESKSQSQEPMSQDSQPLSQMLLDSQPLSQEPMSQDSQPLSQMSVDSQPLSQEPMSQMPVDSQPHSQEPMFQDSQPLSQMSLDSQPLSQELMSQDSQPLSQMPVDSQPRSQQLMSQDSQNSQQPMSQIQ